jgi:hypothetical protein
LEEEFLQLDSLVILYMVENVEFPYLDEEWLQFDSLDILYMVEYIEIP